MKAETLPNGLTEETIEEDPRNAIVNELALFEGTSDEPRGRETLIFVVVRL